MALRWLGVRWRLPTPKRGGNENNHRDDQDKQDEKLGGEMQSAADPFRGVVWRQHTTRKHTHAAVPTDSAQNVEVWKPLMTRMKKAPVVLQSDAWSEGKKKKTRAFERKGSPGVFQR